MSQSYYSILKILTSATQRDIKIAYRQLAQKHHPDVNKSGNDDIIKQINIAYETLSSPVKKAIYDQSLRGNSQQPVTQPYNNPSPVNRSARRPLHNFYRYRHRSSDTSYTYSTKTKIQGWGAVIIVIALICGGIRAMHYYTSEHYFKEAVLAQEKKEFNRAFNLYQLAIRDWGSKNVEASIKIAELGQQVGSYYAMVDNAKKGLTYNPDTAETARLYYLKGVGYSKTQRYQKAEMAFINSLNFKFNKDSVYYKLGAIYLNKLLKYKEAEKIYTYLLIDEFNNSADYYNRALCQQHLGQHPQAIKDFLIILKDDGPHNGKILFQLGRSYLALNQKEVACEYLRKAQSQGVNINPDEFATACG